MKSITINVQWPYRIDAFDNEGQSVSVSRTVSTAREPEDSDECVIISRLMGDAAPVIGNTPWGEAFAAIQRMFNCTSL